MTPPTSLLKLRWGVLAIFAMLIAMGGACFSRGVYDGIFMMKGCVLVVNSTEATHHIQLSFPSGKHMNFDLASGASWQAKVDDTGEGSIQVLVDGSRSESIGYVTSFNPMIVLTVTDTKIVETYVVLTPCDVQ